jgi:hypothetical protein
MEVPAPNVQQLIKVLVELGRWYVKDRTDETSETSLYEKGIKYINEAIAKSDESGLFRSGADCRLVKAQLSLSLGRQDDESLDWIINHHSPAVTSEQREHAKKLKKSITDEEMRAVFAAMTIEDGYNFGTSASDHWFECPNGHPYFIGNCGGAMQEGVCNECGARVGGSSHVLLGSNRPATSLRRLF